MPSAIKAVEFGGQTLQERMRELINALGGPTKTASLVSSSPETVTNWRTGKTRAPFDSICKMTEAAGVSIDWLATGIHKDAGTISNEIIKIKRFNIGLSAGDGAEGAGEMIEPLEFRLEWLRSHIGVNPNQLTVVYAMGDSMEPTIRNRALLLVDNSSCNIQNDGVYAFRMDDALYIKRVQKQMTGGILLISDNPAYPPQAIDNLETVRFEILGQVRWVGNDL